MASRLHTLLLLRHRLRNLLAEIDAQLFLVERQYYSSGPEASREEVAPSGRSPQRDCRSARVAPAFC